MSHVQTESLLCALMMSGSSAGVLLYFTCVVSLLMCLFFTTDRSDMHKMFSWETKDIHLLDKMLNIGQALRKESNSHLPFFFLYVHSFHVYDLCNVDCTNAACPPVPHVCIFVTKTY